MVSAKIRQEIEERFGSAVASDEKLLSECANICEMFNMSPETLYYKWEAHSFNNTRSISVLTIEAVVSLKASIQRELTAENSKRHKARANLPATVSRGRSLAARYNQLRNANIPSATTGIVTDVRGDDLRGVGRSDEMVLDGPKINIASNKSHAYHYMYETPTRRGKALNGQIEYFELLIREHYRCEEFSDPAACTEGEVTVVGRITLDAESSSSGAVKLNEMSLALEASRNICGGIRVSLKFDPQLKIRGGPSGAGGLSFFPGAIVAFRGRNGSGPEGYFVVTEILVMPPMKPSPAVSLRPWPGSPFSMYIACGPYTSDADLTYGPWNTLLTSLKATKPDVVILTGPFIDATHPKIKAGDIDAPPSQLFHEHFIRNFQELFTLNPSSNVILIPSVRDIISQHVVFPQTELGAEFSGGDPRIRLFPNPCRFTLNDISFAATSVDVLSHLKKEEYFKFADEVGSVQDPSGRDLMSATCRHILQQRSFYPVFPVPFDLLHDVNLDVSHSDLLKLDFEAGVDYAPDVFITPSKLRHFAKVTQNTMFINPSFLSKGTCATLTLLPGENSLKDRMRVKAGKLHEIGHP